MGAPALGHEGRDGGWCVMHRKRPGRWHPYWAAQEHTLAYRTGSIYRPLLLCLERGRGKHALLQEVRVWSSSTLSDSSLGSG
jgi:hypothetical protein